jgi:phage tail sheath protein FI
MPLVGGFDGVDVTEADPFRNSIFNNITPTETTNYEYYTLRRAVDTVADPELLVTDIIAMPGITNTNITSHMVTTAENRADCMAIIDVPSYKPDSEGQITTTTRLGDTVDQVVAALKGRNINSSYAATYYPWVQIRDTINNQNVWVPPSVVALGALSYGQASQELWFAPAGFTRGGLSEGRGGVPVIGVTERLSSKDRDTLYEANINPIAQFPAEGIVIRGYKNSQTVYSPTLQKMLSVKVINQDYAD